MKLVAINEIHYTDRQGKQAVAKPGEYLDLKVAEAKQLLNMKPLPPVREMTDQENELEKLRASAKTTTAAADTDDGDGGINVSTEGNVQSARTPTAAGTKPAPGTTAAAQKKQDEKPKTDESY